MHTVHGTVVLSSSRRRSLNLSKLLREGDPIVQFPHALSAIESGNRKVPTSSQDCSCFRFPQQFWTDPMLDTFCHLLAKNRDHRGTHSPSEREPSSNGIRISAHTANISVSTPRSYLSHVSPHLLAYIIR